MATDLHSSFREGLSDPADDGEAITPHDSNELTNVTRGIYVGVTGDIAVTTWQGTALTFKNAQQGTVIPVRVKIVKSTGTTATNLIGLH